MNFYQLKTVHSESFSAWGKAPSDVTRISEKMGAITLDVRRYNPESKLFSKIQHIGWYFRCFGCFGMKPHSVCLFQHPFYASRGVVGRFEDWLMLTVFRLYRIRIIVIVHDIGHWRKLVAEDEFNNEAAFLAKYADCLIVHNASMRRRLALEGVPNEKMIELGIFDYLIEGDKPPLEMKNFRQVIIAGNLRPDKVPYLRELPIVSDVDWHLYGKQIENQFSNVLNIHYEGCYPSEEIPKYLRCGFGLVWDGTSVKGCMGNTGEYLRYNNPHKLSLYLASGLPVIVWTESATAAFVREHNVGVAIQSLNEIGGILNALTDEQYCVLRQNVLKLSEEIRQGRFMSMALQKAFKKLEDNC